MFANQYLGKRVFVTGHTGFKGAWLCEWLLQLGADVTGYSDRDADQPLFQQLGLAGRLRHRLGDVRDAAALQGAVRDATPDVVFHLAAQSLVRPSYIDPAGTFATNVMGTVHLLEALRLADRPVACVVVTSDKCYENREVLHGYRESDPLGGHDPYSASKGAAEIVVQAYRRSFFSESGNQVYLASARAGNVIGGGDGSADRIVPDCVRSLQSAAPVLVRNALATRPWQHVLEPLSGYLWLGAVMSGALRLPRVRAPADVCTAFNFGPLPESNRSVGELVDEVFRHWPGQRVDAANATAVHEAGLLGLSIDKAFHLLGWHPVWNFARSVAASLHWYRHVHDGGDALMHTRADLNAYMDDARANGLRWTGAE